jgi:predicted AAA+ superfamily ATPase
LADRKPFIWPDAGPTRSAAASQPLHPRFAAQALERSLADSPAVLIHGPRQSGKTTLAQTVGDARGYAYFSFDEDVVRSAGAADPAGFVADLPKRCILDEVQRVPDLFAAVKVAVDRFRAGVVQYDGESALGFGDGLFAVPIRALWELT